MQSIPKKIVNPMTIIAIFAALSETSAAVSLPFLNDDDREIYIWFLISFPFYLLFLFFITLNFNYKSLYAPSDFQKGKHFIKVFDDTARAQKKPSGTPPPTAEDDTGSPTISAGSAALAQNPTNRAELKNQPDYLLQSAQDPPAQITLISRLANPRLVPLPAAVHCIRMVDARWVRKKKDTTHLMQKINQVPHTQQTLTMLLTCPDSEQLINETLKKSAIRAMNADDSLCMYYNLNTQTIRVIVPRSITDQSALVPVADKKDSENA